MTAADRTAELFALKHGLPESAAHAQSSRADGCRLSAAAAEGRADLLIALAEELVDDDELAQAIVARLNARKPAPPTDVPHDGPTPIASVANGAEVLP